MCTCVRFLRNTTKIFKTKKWKKSDNFVSLLTLIKAVRIQAEPSIVVEGRKSEGSTNETQSNKTQGEWKVNLRTGLSKMMEDRQATKTEPKPRSKVPEVSVSASSAKN